MPGTIEKEAVKVGDSLWYNPSDRQRGTDCGWIKIHKVGRKWITLINGVRVDRRTMITDEWPAGKCYLSEEACLADVRMNMLWKQFVSRVSFRLNRPDDLSADELIAMARKLGFEIAA